MPRDGGDNSTELPVRARLPTEPVGVLGSFARMQENLLSIIPQAATEQKILSGRTGTRWHMVMHPPALREILLERVADYPKSVVTRNLLRPAVGDSLFVAEGAHWRWQRRAAAPAFSHRNIASLGPVMTGAATRSADRIASQKHRAVNLLDEMTTATFDVISEVTFSTDGSFERASVHRAIEAYTEKAGRVSLLDVLGAPDWVPRPGRVAATRSMQKMKADADAAIEARLRRGPSATPDLLDLMREAEDPRTGRRMSTSELRDNLLTFIVAGHETTALTLAWALYLCTFDQNVQDAARHEIHSVVGQRAAEAGDLENLGLVRRIIEETLRLYPPAGIVSRTAQKQDTLAGAPVEPGDTVMIPIYALGRHRTLWQDPDSFRPQRFADRQSIDRYAWLPFGDGPRICIGASFALQEAMIILATLLGRFRFTRVPGRDPAPVMILTLRPDGGVWLTAEPV
ncbi:cytochrome P450 [uncultured Roseobacter sp.]|uniref:cytochrome P450 n=1 Tax=uncultured Roseobacter sp. TaxID=114847 RepID=UPI002627FB08|nr:cytochrome P450 [uncultured Roseobacter sp.]